MKRHWIRLLGLAVLFAAVLPALADDKPDEEPLPEEDTILGTWYMQVMEGEVVPREGLVKIVFDEKGVVRVFEEGEEAEVGRFTHDRERAKLTLYEENDPTDIEAVIHYTFVDDMVVLRVTEDPGKGGDEKPEVFEMTRNREGTERHKRLREKAEEK